MKTKDKEQRRVMILLGAIVFLLIVIIFSSIFYIRSTRPMRQARNEAIEIAQKYTDLKEVDQFYWFNRQASSFSLVGTDDKDASGELHYYLLGFKDGKEINAINNI